MKLYKIVIISLFLFLSYFKINAQQSVARKWNQVLLFSISNDFARPPVHARNLFHTSVLMYDSWAVYDPKASTYFLGKEFNGTTVPFVGISNPIDRKYAVETTLSYACCRLIKHRFQFSPGKVKIYAKCDSLLNALGYDVSFTNEEYQYGDYAALGNYLANQMISYGYTDGSNELNDFSNQFYHPVNAPLNPRKTGNQTLTHPNNWQPLAFDVFIDQSGNIVNGAVPKFMGPEWGYVHPFSLTENDKKWVSRDGMDFPIYLDPGKPVEIGSGGIEDQYKWSFLMVAMWSSHLHPSDSVKWDISPASLGDLKLDLNNIPDIRTLYKDSIGGDMSKGYTVNPITNLPYTPQVVYRGDYARVLAEFWADGPKSLTPPGHWFYILNYVMDQPNFVRKFKGEGEILSDIEWDVKAYLTLGGTMHDCAVAAWGIKGYYDYVRPISAIRYMAGKGQSSDKNLPNYSEHGLPLLDGFSEQIQVGDPLAGTDSANVGKIKVRSWKGPRYISNPLSDDAGVAWILAEDWWPYQRPTFITPPFAGYVSGHSTFSRAGAEVLGAITGSPYFPNGIGEFIAKKNEFLVFEDGPSQTLTLQWATYVDASNQTSLSRIWGGIHPPVDDIVGRKLGMQIAEKCVDLSEQFFNGKLASTYSLNESELVFPNPFKSEALINVQMANKDRVNKLELISSQGKVYTIIDYRQVANQLYFESPRLVAGIYTLRIKTDNGNSIHRVISN